MYYELDKKTGLYLPSSEEEFLKPKPGIDFSFNETFKCKVIQGSMSGINFDLKAASFWELMFCDQPLKARWSCLKGFVLFELKPNFFRKVYECTKLYQLIKKKKEVVVSFLKL